MKFPSLPNVADLFDDDLELESDDDIFYSGEHDEEMARSLKKLSDVIQSMKVELEQSSKTSQKQFCVTFIISLLALIAAIVAAVAAVIPLLPN